MTGQNAFETETESYKDDSTFHETVTSSFEHLDISVDKATNNKKALASALDLVIGLMREAELKDKAAEEAKMEAATNSLDILAKVDALKQAQQRKKQTNDTHARHVYAQKAALAKKLKEIQLHVSGVLIEGDCCLGVFDEMRSQLEMRMTSALREKELADKEKLEKETLAQEALAFEESQMFNLVEESKRLKQESEKITTLLDFLDEREFDVNNLDGDVSDKYQDINFFRECLDQPILRLNGFLSSSQTSSIPSSSSSLTRSLLQGHDPQQKKVASNGASKKTAGKRVHFVDEFVPPKNGPLLKTPDLVLKKHLAELMRPFFGFGLPVVDGLNEKVKITPVVADITEGGHSMSTEGSVASAQTYAERVAAPLSMKHDVKKGPPQKPIESKKIKYSINELLRMGAFTG